MEAEPAQQPADAPNAPGFELVFLGSGTSAGVPMIACAGGEGMRRPADRWPPCACLSEDPRDDRDRASILVRYPDPEGRVDPATGTTLLRQVVVDTGPEFRRQCLRERMQRIDAVLYTHAHADHILGIDDLRRFNAAMDAPIDIYAEPSVLDTLRRMFVYIFEPHRNVNQSFVATLLAREIEPQQAWDLHGLSVTPLRLMHGRLPILGFRFQLAGDRLAAAYCTDVSTIPPETYPLLADLDVLVIDGLRYRHHPTHMNIERALAVIDGVRPRRAYLTHIAHDIIHAELEEQLPQGVHVAYDGLSLAVRNAPGAVAID